MSILIDDKKRVIIQGITGREGQARAKLMMNYGTNVIAGCTPGKGGQETLGISVYDTVSEAVEAKGEIDISVIFVPAPIVKDAAIEAFDSAKTIAEGKVGELMDKVSLGCRAIIKQQREINPATELSSLV